MTNQWTLFPGLRPTAITCSSLTWLGRPGLPGTRAEYWPAASRSGLWETLIPPRGELELELEVVRSSEEYQASRLSLYSTSQTSRQPDLSNPAREQTVS